MFSNFLSENRAVYEMMSKNKVEPEVTDDNVIRRMGIACLISRVTRARTHPYDDARAPTPARTHTQKYVTHCFFYGNNVFVNAPEC
jgi:hypothetical protein